METNINSILCRVRHLIYSNRIEEASLIAEPYTLVTDYVLQHCNHKLDPIYKDSTVFKYKYTNTKFTGNGLGCGCSYGDGYGDGDLGYGTSFGDGSGIGHLGYGTGSGCGNGCGYGNWSGNGSDYPYYGFY